METNQSSTPALHPPIAPSPLEVSKDHGFELRLREPTKVLFLIRYFLTKSVWRGEELQSWEEAALHLLWVQYEGCQDPYHIGKNVMQWLAAKQVFKIWKENAVQTNWGQATLRLLHKNCSFFLSPRAFLSQEISSSEVLKRINRALYRKPRPPRRIGVGYRDKGTARQRHHDGSPSWEDVVAGSPDEVRKRDTDEALWVRLRTGMVFPIVPVSSVPFGSVRYVEI
jgi:hypothetical protein